MKKIKIGLSSVFCFVVLISSISVQSQPKIRTEIPEEHTWNLRDIYESDEAWRNAKEEVEQEMGKMEQYKGKVTSSAENLLACLNLQEKLEMKMDRLMLYASMSFDLDTRKSKYNAMEKEMQKLFSDYNALTAFVEPEILDTEKSIIEKYISQKEGFNKFDFYLREIFRKKEHKLSEKEEKILAKAGPLASSPYSIYSIFSNADFPYKQIELSNGELVTLDKAGYSRYRSSSNRKEREMVFNAFFGSLMHFESTFGEQLTAQVNRDIFYAGARSYNSSLEYALDRNNIPVEVYHNLVQNVNDNLVTLHRYLNLKKRMLQLDTLKYSDLYASAVKNVDLRYSIEEGKKLVYEAIKPLGEEYANVVKEGFENQWMDIFPTTGKRSGAYSTSAYDVHPYILLNYNDQYDDVKTLAHELGHTMHSYLSNKNQPYPKADYSIFVAEVASTFNEALLFEKMNKELKDNEVRLSLLMNYLDGIRTTVFRQTQFAEFELAIHEKAEKGEALTGETYTKIYSDIIKKYYGHDKNICKIDDLYTIEWAYIPHFYYTYYVYQYSTSFTASLALAEKVMGGEDNAREKYLTFLSSGGSDYPIEILKKAGVDMTTSDPFNETMTAMNRIMDEIEEILEKMNR